MTLPPKPKSKTDKDAGKVAPGTLTDTKIVGTDTGTGGFEIEGELETLDPGASDTRATYGVFSRGDINVDNTQKDISKVTRITLGQYLGRSTKNNEYPIDAVETSDVSITSEKRLPAKLSPSTNSSQFRRDLPPSLSNEAPTIAGFRRGKSDPMSDVDGNRLLPEATVDDKKELNQASPLKAYTSAVLGKNRFTPEKTMASSQLRRYRHVPESMGKYQPGDSPTANVQDFSQKRMAQVGPALSMRSGIELLSGNDGFNPSNTAAEAGAILPGVAQLGVRRIDNVMLSAGDVMDSLYTDESADSTITIDPMSLSWGTMNNTSDQFSGASALGMAALSAALVFGVEVVIELLSVVLSGVGKGKRPTRDSIGRYTLGSYMSGQKPKDTNSIAGVIGAALPPDLGSLLGLRPTRSQFSACVKVGSRAFFGIKSTGGLLGGIVGAAAAGAMSDNPGYNAVICRAIIRSGVSVADAIKHIGGNPISIAKGILGMLDVLKSSKIISAINVFAQLGDQILNTPDEWTDNLAEGVKVSSMDTSANTNAVNKSRLDGTLKLAWAANRAPSVMLLPRAIIASRGETGSDAPSFGLTSFDSDTKHQVRVNESRLSQEDVDKIESQLDAEYVPFYFHDLRTNEIISFHAFLESISDDYTANYESSEGFGRVDPVKIYKSTTRKIGVSFRVVATSQMDFDDMWIKLNKLTTLVYPQYTAGRMITNGSDYTIRQPFSQLIGASPMIRLRLGDLFKSNYSKFALARLFGMGEQGVKIDGKSIGNLEKFDDAIINDLKSYIERVKKIPSNVRFHISSMGNYPLSVETAGTTILSVGQKTPLYAETYLGGELPQDLIQIKIVNSDGAGSVRGTVEWNEEAKERYKNVLAAYDEIYGSIATSPAKKLIGGTYTFPVSALAPTQESISRVIAEKLPRADAGYVTAFNEFMKDSDSTSGNAIARSFRTVGGKGLAGFIDSMNYDWFSQVTWETMPDRTAPQMCKVTLSFSPIHDISPGLDSTGFDRAPVYPVGPMSPRKIKR